MTESFPNWITEQMIKGIKKEELDSYMMALEGWRRGLSLTWYYDQAEVTDMKITENNPFGKTFSLYSDKNNQLHYFYRSRGNKVKNDAITIVANKHLAKKHLTKAEVPVPESVMFEKKLENDTLLQLVKDLQYPLVVKPTIGSLASLGRDTVTNIRSEEALIHAIEQVRENYEYDDILVEEHVTGEEYRLYVVNNQVAATVKRNPANIIGNGRETIEELITEKNKQRKSNPYLKEHPIIITNDVLNYLKENGQFIQNTPGQGDLIQLSDKTHIHAGGDSVDATNEVSDEIRQAAINAVKAIAGLEHAGVDIVVTNGQIFVLEIHANADLGLHLFPSDGASQNVPSVIMDYYFPETKGLSAKRDKIFFDYVDINDVLQKKFAQELTVTDAPNGELHTTRFIVSGKVQKVDYRAWIRKQAIKKGLHGYTKNLDNGRVVVIVGGADKKQVDNFKQICLKGSPRSKVQKVKELEWTSPIKVGFEIRKS